MLEDIVGDLIEDALSGKSRKKTRRRRRERKKDRKKGRKKDRKWIQKAIKHPGALKRWLKRNAKKVEKVTGEKPFTKSGEVNTRALQKLKKTEWYGKLSDTKKRINLAITLEKMHKG
ncbi:hypothetical protein DRP04_11610 [Archaeoglobales archaeon]|nr:MAG: hypothetical protein DRP04_11610 [Archaeoglobales archaeon]